MEAAGKSLVGAAGVGCCVAFGCCGTGGGEE